VNRLEVMEQVVSCETCELHENVVAPVFGTIPEGCRIAVVGEAPGEQEDDQGRPFIGPAGQLLRRLLTDAGIDPDTVAFINTVSCWPHGTPTWDHINACAPNKTAQLALTQPRLVIPVGQVAIKGFKPYLSAKHGRGRPWVQDGMVFCATYHPAAALRNGNYEKAIEADLQTIVEVLEADDGEPWDEWPSWLSFLIPDTCAGCPLDLYLLDYDGLGWCEVHMPSHMIERMETHQAYLASLSRP
jgi:uracil-DNA glycosylase family 4